MASHYKNSCSEKETKQLIGPFINPQE